MDKRYLCYSISMTVILIFAGLAFALIPHTPLHQNMGTYDIVSKNLTETSCRGCHASGVPDTHHDPAAAGKYPCMDCHPVITDPDGRETITMVGDCMQCHNGTFNNTTFNNITIRKPHHETKNAQDGHCSDCHGNIVDDYDDGHYIPIYKISLVTPDPKYREINATTGEKFGGCESCHEQNKTLSPPVYSNKKTHHNLGSVSGFNPSNISKCAVCHDLQSNGSGSIRNCERCHAIKSLHNIQYNYSGTKGQFGYGHIGAGDCNGCHASYMAAVSGTAPGTDVIVPVINSISTGKVTEGMKTMLIIHGSNLVTTVDGVNHSSVVVLTDEINPITLTPAAINSTDIIVTVPALSKGDYGVYALKNGSVKSNRLPLVSVPGVKISSAVNVDNKVTIRGSGFGYQYDPLYNNWINVSISYDNRETVAYRSVQITNWSDTLININSPDVMAGDIVTVNSIYGTNSKEVVPGVA